MNARLALLLVSPKNKKTDKWKIKVGNGIQSSISTLYQTIILAFDYSSNRRKTSVTIEISPSIESSFFHLTISPRIKTS